MLGDGLKVFDPTAYLDSEEAIAAYLELARETQDPDCLARALDNVRRARERLAAKTADRPNKD
ncbi:MAG: hypothetical protein ABW003_10665 [Microvirga sp.]